MKSNQEFHHPDLVGENPPDFIYDHKNDRVFRVGDHIKSKSNQFFRINAINHKNQSISTDWVGGVEQDVEWRPKKSGYGNEPYKIKPSWSMKNGGLYGDKWEHIPGAVDVQEMNDLASVHNFSSYSKLPMSEKARLWEKFKPNFLKHHGQLVENDDGTVSKGAYASKDMEKIINPFKPEGYHKIVEAMKNTPLIYGSYKNDVMNSQTVELHDKLKKEAERIYEVMKNNGGVYKAILVRTGWKG